MKTNRFFAALMLGFAFVACTPKASEPAAAEGDAEEAPKEMTLKDYEASKVEINEVSYLLGINFGSFIKGYNFGEDINYAEVVKGIKDFVSAKGNYQDENFADQFKVNPESMNEVFNGYLEKRHNYTMLANKDKSAKFLADMAKKDGVVVTESGLEYKIIEPGNDRKPGPADTVYVNYKGTLMDGTVFDETPQGEEPVALVLSRVIPGWTEGLQLIGEGGHVELYIPANLAYGENGTQGIEPNSALVFDVVLSKVGRFVEAAE